MSIPKDDLIVRVEYVRPDPTITKSLFERMDFLLSLFFVLTVSIIGMIIAMFQWWYTRGWKHAFISIISRPANVLEKFSVSILLKTLFEPWKQIKSYVGAKSSFDMKMQAMLDNAFARTFGFVLRSSLISIATVIAFFVFLFNLLLAIIWPLVPVAPIILVVIGLMSNA